MLNQIYNKMNSQIHSQSNVDEIVSIASQIRDALSEFDFKDDKYFTELKRRLCENIALMSLTLEGPFNHIDLEDVEHQRIKAANVIFNELESKTLWPDKLIREAAEKVLSVLQYYNSSTTYLSYYSESTNINSLLKKLKQSDIMEFTAVIPGLQILINQLEKAQFSFEHLFMKNISNFEECKESFSSIRVGNRIIKQLNNELLIYLKTMAQVYPKKFFECYHIVETIVINNNNRVVRRNNILSRMLISEVN